MHLKQRSTGGSIGTVVGSYGSFLSVHTWCMEESDSEAQQVAATSRKGGPEKDEVLLKMR
jgi:hypothetical protein